MLKEKTTLSKRQMIRERARKQRRRQKLLPLLLLAAGVLLVGVSVYWVAGGRPARAAKDYNPEDVVYGQTLLAIHEMEPFNMASIPFLPKGDPQPKIAISESFYNFGVIGSQDVVTREFVIANQGPAPLTISRAYTTCGCTIAEFTADVIPPGKVALMKLTFDAGFHETGGQTVRRGVIIENNDPDSPQVEIWVEARVRTTP